jgi:hypothetical protein
VDDWDGPLPDGVSPTAARRTRFANPANQNIRGDHPLNLGATMLHLNAYLLTGDEKYRRGLLDYVDAWAERSAANGGNFWGSRRSRSSCCSISTSAPRTARSPRCCATGLGCGAAEWRDARARSGRSPRGADLCDAARPDSRESVRQSG